MVWHEVTETQFIEIVLRNPVCATILGRLRSLALPDAWLVSGALFQSVWNAVTCRDPSHGIKDYDIFYFDPDTSWDAEDAVIARVRRELFHLPVNIELRNQARVHLWYELKFGVSYKPLYRTTDGIDRFLMPCAQVGMRPVGMGYEIYAPSGFADLESMIVQPNRVPNFQPAPYYEKAMRWKETWPELTVTPL